MCVSCVLMNYGLAFIWAANLCCINIS